MTPSEEILLHQIRTKLTQVQSLIRQSLSQKHSDPLLITKLMKVKTMIRRKHWHTAGQELDQLIYNLHKCQEHAPHKYTA